jgi:hypothetical protein
LLRFDEMERKYRVSFFRQLGGGFSRGFFIFTMPQASTFNWAFPKKCLCYSVSIANKVSITLWAVPKESPIPLGATQMVSKNLSTHLQVCLGIHSRIYIYKNTFPSKHSVY